MSGVWLFVVPVGIIALLFVLKAVRDVGRSVGTLAESMKDLRDAGVGITQLRDDLARQRAVIEDPPPQ